MQSQNDAQMCALCKAKCNDAGLRGRQMGRRCLPACRLTFVLVFVREVK